MNKQKGVLMHISSLNSEFCIGTLGKGAYNFVDFLSESNQNIWQILPLTLVDDSNSPYQSQSAFAGNTLFIDFTRLYRDGYITKADYSDIEKTNNRLVADYEMAKRNSRKVLQRACDAFDTTNEEYLKFCLDNKWLNDYAVFMAICDVVGGGLKDFPQNLMLRESVALCDFCRDNMNRVEYYKITQFLFFKQWHSLKTYSNSKGIKIVGDMPIYVSFNSCDLWTNSKYFNLDENLNVKEVAGVPPDDFCADGQLWGNPTYNWSELKNSNYEWWLQRISHNLKMYDGVRIDHFRGFESYFAIPAGSINAKQGEWKRACGYDFFEALKSKFDAPFVIAEDLGFITDEVKQLVKMTGFPNMRVAQFGFNDNGASEHYPLNYNENCVAYLGTHDNNTTRSWLKNASAVERSFVTKSVRGMVGEDITQRLINFVKSSRASIVIICMQDYLYLDGGSRMNTPSTTTSNWQWRISPRYRTGTLIDKM